MAVIHEFGFDPEATFRADQGALGLRPNIIVIHPRILAGGCFGVSGCDYLTDVGIELN